MDYLWPHFQSRCPISLSSFPLHKTIPDFVYHCGIVINKAGSLTDAVEIVERTKKTASSYFDIGVVEYNNCNVVYNTNRQVFTANFKKFEKLTMNGRYSSFITNYWCCYFFVISPGEKVLTKTV